MHRFTFAVLVIVLLSGSSVVLSSSVLRGPFLSGNRLCPQSRIPIRNCPKYEVFNCLNVFCTQPNCFERNVTRCSPQAACVCQAGFIRLDAGLRCVRTEECLTVEDFE